MWWSRRHLRFLIKCDDDAFVDIDMVIADLIASAPVGLHVWDGLKPYFELWSTWLLVKEIRTRVWPIMPKYLPSPHLRFKTEPAGLLWGHVPWPFCFPATGPKHSGSRSWHWWSPTEMPQTNTSSPTRPTCKRKKHNGMPSLPKIFTALWPGRSTPCSNSHAE